MPTLAEYRNDWALPAFLAGVTGVAGSLLVERKELLGYWRRGGEG